VEPAVEHVYKSHADVVRRALRSFGVDPDALDDAVQDVFVVLVRRCADFDPRMTWTNWLWGIARRVARGYRRGAGRRERLHAVLPTSSVDATLDDELARLRALEFLDAFVTALPPVLVDAFVLAELEGFTAPEIAAQTGVNLNTVYARIRAVRRRFDEAIAAEQAPKKTGAWWLFGVPWWTLAVTTACVALTIGFTELAIEARPSHDTAIAMAEPVAAATRNPPVSAKDRDMPSSRKLAAPLVVGVVAGTLAAAPADAKPKPQRAKTEAARAAEPSDQDADDAARRASAGGLTIYDFDGDTVGGERLSPDGFNVLSRGDVKMESLLRIRGHFIRELIVMGTDV
jgi:RNA polymerase sigma-70 factor (ECF subfamily)